MKKSRKKKSNKTRLIILEGESDKRFFQDLKKKFNKKELEISPLKKEGLNFNKINKLIKVSIDELRYKEVWLAMDLKTRKIGTERDYSTKEEILSVYRQHIEKPDRVDYIVMVLDLECWLLLYFSKYNNTETIKNSEKKLKKLMDIGGSISKLIMVNRLIRKPDFWNKLIENKEKNKSFMDFLNKIEI